MNVGLVTHTDRSGWISEQPGKNWRENTIGCADRVLLLRNALNGPTMSPLEFHLLVQRVRSEFMEMPGLQLTVQQAARFWGLDPGSCEAVMETLTRAEFLRRTAAGTFARADD